MDWARWTDHSGTIESDVDTLGRTNPLHGAVDKAEGTISSIGGEPGSSRDGDKCNECGGDLEELHDVEEIK